MNLWKAYSQVMKQQSDLQLPPLYTQLLHDLNNQLYSEDTVLTSPTHGEKPYDTLSISSIQFLPKEAWSNSWYIIAHDIAC